MLLNVWLMVANIRPMLALFKNVQVVVENTNIEFLDEKGLFTN